MVKAISFYQKKNSDLCEMVSITVKTLSQQLKIYFILTAAILVVEEVVEAKIINYLGELHQEQLLVN